MLMAIAVSTEKSKGLLGFAVHREGGGKRAWLKGSKVFESRVPQPPARAQYSSLDHPFQSLLWGDYTVEPGTTYTLTIRPMYGTPTALEPGTDIELTVTT